MASVNDIRTSKYLKKEEVGEGRLVTIKALTKENIAVEGVEPEYKFVLYFQELEKPFVLNSTNAQMIGKITGFDDNIEANWLGKQIVLYDEPNVSFQGKLVGGIRCRAPKFQKPDLPF